MHRILWHTFCAPCAHLTLHTCTFTQVWSNTIVIADFFGPRESTEWYWASWIGMAIPATYCLIGGMRASLVSDFVQTILAYALLILTYFVIQHRVSVAVVL